KMVWLKWMELRIHNEVDVIETPTGYIPTYDDLKELFKLHLDKDYSRDDYELQFAIRVPELLNKIERIENIYRVTVADTPELLFYVLLEQRNRLLTVQNQIGDYITPSTLV
ncbi:MAG: phosphoenolpyruvate carboxykinase domain-containing protein, partial [Candidatus Thorarchaeota archaeon]